MNSMVVMTCIAAALLSPACAGWAGDYAPSGWAAAPANIALSADGKNVLDTPEVAHAKAAHLAALADAQARSGHQDSNDDGSYDPRWDNEEAWQAPAAPSWQQSAPSWGHAATGHGPAPVADTPEVAQAKVAHFAAVAAAQGAARAAPASSGWNHAPAPAWGHAAAPSWNHGAAAPAPIRLSADGQHVLDTPEVAQAKAAHLAALAAAGGSSHGYGAPAQYAAAPAWSGAPSWHAAPAHAPAHAPAQVRLSHDGQHVLDTPEVAHARAAHLAAHAQAAAQAGPAHHAW